MTTTTEASTARRAAMLLPWVDIAQTWLDEGKPEKAEQTLRAGMAVVRWDLTERRALGVGVR